MADEPHPNDTRRVHRGELVTEEGALGGVGQALSAALPSSPGSGGSEPATYVLAGTDFTLPSPIVAAAGSQVGYKLKGGRLQFLGAVVIPSGTDMDGLASAIVPLGASVYPAVDFEWVVYSTGGLIDAYLFNNGAGDPQSGLWLQNQVIDGALPAGLVARPAADVTVNLTTAGFDILP